MGFFEYMFGKKELTVNAAINKAREDKKNSYLVDIRPKEDYKAGHVPGAINIPYNKLHMLENRIRNKDAYVYLIGNYAHAPRKTIGEVRKLGYKNVVSGGQMEEHHGMLSKG